MGQIGLLPRLQLLLIKHSSVPDIVSQTVAVLSLLCVDSTWHRYVRCWRAVFCCGGLWSRETLALPV